jgi:adenine-specific DNA-methyltransferase
LAVVDGLVNEAVIRLLLDQLPVTERLCVCGTAIDPAVRSVLRTLRPGSTMKKVPAALLDEYRTSRRERLALAHTIDWAEAAKFVDVEDEVPAP